ncbi:serine/threonine-protein kinase [Acanthopleuribacter pedis]|uniref:Serine/threonine protein kinase n=1 Tax=Acanthopleuribacter pedis TaxID=442870 RepID=A0A8J7QNP8_9BACT|nr:serine/threonine-protein kinase [Acanthopleuribacter pedis]MBO1321788.1 serine/threonine protein kinase [Acanthopleuribacter pedis]
MDTASGEDQFQHIFIAALDLSGEARDAFLDKVCRKQPDLREEIEEILATLDPTELTGSKEKRALDIFGFCLDLDREARAMYLAKVAERCAEVREKVDKLLTSHGEAADAEFIEASPMADPEQVPSTGLKANDVVGPYRVIHEIGRGGMGAVYMATRKDEEFEQEVALKILPYAMATQDLISRFNNERQIMANLSHPNIATLLDGGATDDGLPYFVMEYVDGVPIHDYCDFQKLTIAARLRLFRKVCSAVHFAHQNLVVHRDLKPGNILVTAAGEPKLLDFGIAKILRPGSHEPVTLTESGVRPMTPEYASPEQVRGEIVTTESDIYALGLLLYELLSGHRAHRFGNRTEEDVQRVVCDDYPPRPSVVFWERFQIERARGTVVLTPESISEKRRTDPRRMERQLRGDLDNMIMKAITKDPDLRYASAEQFSLDIVNYLSGHPVLARGHSPLYLMQRFWERHQFAMMTTFIMVVMVLLFVVTALVQHRETLAQRRAAEMQRAKAHFVGEFFSDLFAVPQVGGPAGEIPANLITDRAMRRIQEFYPDNPAVQAAVMHTVGSVCLNLGAENQAESIITEALALRREQGEARDVAESLRVLAGIHARRRHFDKAECLLLEARSLTEAEDDQIAALMDGQVLQDLAEVYDGQGRHDLAEPMLWRALAVFHNQDQRDPERVSRILYALISHYQELEKWSHEEVLLKWALEEQIQAGSDEYLVHTFARVAEKLRREGEHARADYFLQCAFDLSRETYGAQHRLARNLEQALREFDETGVAEPEPNDSPLVQ